MFSRDPVISSKIPFALEPSFNSSRKAGAYTAIPNVKQHNAPYTATLVLSLHTIFGTRAQCTPARKASSSVAHLKQKASRSSRRIEEGEAREAGRSMSQS